LASSEAGCQTAYPFIELIALGSDPLQGLHDFGEVRRFSGEAGFLVVAALDAVRVVVTAGGFL
jgi:hypothetical protein